MDDERDPRPHPPAPRRDATPVPPPPAGVDTPWVPWWTAVAANA